MHPPAQLHLGSGNGEAEIAAAYAADTMSDLIAHAAPDTLLVTSLDNNQLLRVAELMDVPGICIAGAGETAHCLSPETATAILLSRAGMERTCALLAGAGLRVGSSYLGAAPAGFPDSGWASSTSAGTSSSGWASATDFKVTSKTRVRPAIWTRLP